MAPPEPSPDRDDREPSRLERTLRRLLELGAERIAEGPEGLRQWVSELRLPKELVSVLLAQVEETKSEVTKVVVRELRAFLEKTSLADELERILSRLTLEVRTQIRFVPNQAGSGLARPRVRTQVGLKRDETSAVTAEDEAAPEDHAGHEPEPGTEIRDDGGADTTEENPWESH